MEDASSHTMRKEREIKERLTPDVSAALTQPGQSARDGENQLPPGVVVAPGRWPAPSPLRSRGKDQSDGRGIEPWLVRRGSEFERTSDQELQALASEVLPPEGNEPGVDLPSD